MEVWDSVVESSLVNPAGAPRNELARIPSRCSSHNQRETNDHDVSVDPRQIWFRTISSSDS